MDNERFSIDLKKEKQELDSFLSELERHVTLAQDAARPEPPPSLTMETQPLPESLDLELATPDNLETLRLENEEPAPEEKSAPEPVSEETLLVLEMEREPEKLKREEEEASIAETFPPVLEDFSETQSAAALESEKERGFASLDVEADMETEPMPGQLQDEETPQNYSPLTQPEQEKDWERQERQKSSLPIEEKISKKPEQKKSKPAAMDFAPEQESFGTGKWLGIGMGMLAVIILLAALGWYFFIR